MLMIGAQVARGESEPGINKYMKQMNSIRENALFERNRRIVEKKKLFYGLHQQTDLQVIDERTDFINM